MAPVAWGVLCPCRGEPLLSCVSSASRMSFPAVAGVRERRAGRASDPILPAAAGVAIGTMGTQMPIDDLVSSVRDQVTSLLQDES